MAEGASSARTFITVGAMLATGMQALDTTIANVALSHIQGSVAASQEQISWVLTSYIVAAAIMTTPSGWLASRFGVKTVFATAVAGFTIASALCGAATSLAQIVLFRLLQGVFGASLAPLSQTVLLDSYPKEKHGQAMSIWALGITLAPILGPTLGGYLTDFYSWRWVFYINLPAGIISFFLILNFVRDRPDRTPAPRFDTLGFILLSIAIGAFQLMLDRGQLKDWFSSREILAETAIAGLFFYLFLVHAATCSRPFVDLALFKDRNFSASMILMFVVGIVLFSTLALLPQLMQTVLSPQPDHYPVFTAGILLAPRGLGTMLSMLVVERLMRRFDTRMIMAAGFALTALSSWQMSGFNVDAGARELFTSGFIQGIGMGLIWVPVAITAFATLSADKRGEAASIFNLVRNIGSSVGISIVIALLARFVQINHEIIGSNVTPFNPLVRSGDLPFVWNLKTLQGIAALDGQINLESAMIGYINDFTLVMWASLVCIPLVFLLRRSAPPEGGEKIVME